MSVGFAMPNVRVDLVVVLMATLLTIAAIKLTALLPASLYFSFSQAFSDDLGAFLVPRPVLEARQQCELAREKGFSFVDCNNLGQPSSIMSEVEKEAFVQAIVDVQSSVVRDGQLTAIVPSVQRELEQLTAQFDSTLTYRDSIADFREKRIREISQEFIEPYSRAIRARYAALVDAGNAETEAAVDETGPGGPVATAQPKRDVAAIFAQAEYSLMQERRQAAPLVFAPLSLREINRIVDGKVQYWQADRGVETLLVERIERQIAPDYFEKIKAGGLDVEAIAADVSGAVISQNGWQYAAALVIRLLVPLLAAFAVAALLGIGVRRSIAVGCGFAAFLLAWPVALLWEGIVESQYADMRLMFMAFYVAYVVSFVSLGWLGATLGAMANRYWKVRKLVADDEQARFAGVMDLARQLPAQVLINLFSNGVTLVLSFAFFGGDVGYVR